ncbi:hypothetical protein TSOC_002375 [Tetrabaena socialis]|uniref:Dihydroflavonol-4-reductase n=1 Tax=Tetrabaena socialis TaxID=47790 RepID=A0A2J8AED1_9CHLO|nr:hypothetical protein TSOC_002375 [Tetrabaena socialis]|eukprot:PNH10881.1 hypothetical protein TSOC_002375 [Tetrabaena socialis]
MIQSILDGKAYPAAPYMGFGMVDVRDVAAAHCLAMAHPDAKGRYITVCRSILFADIARIIKNGYPNSKLKAPIATAPKWLLWMMGPAAGLSRDLVT